MVTKPNDPIAPFKEQAKRLRAFVSNAGHVMKHSHALEAVATMHGFKDFHTLAASKQASSGIQAYRSDSALDAVADLFDEIVSQRHVNNYTAVSIAAWEALVAAQRETRPETKHHDLVYWSAVEDARLTAARLTLNPLDCFGVHRALAYVSNDGDVSIQAERALDYIEGVREYLDHYAKEDHIPGIDWAEFRVKIRLELAHACTAAHAAFYAWIEDRPIEVVARLFTVAGDLSQEIGLDHFSNGAELARSLCLLHGDLAAAIQCSGHVDSTLPVLSLLDDGIATPIIPAALANTLAAAVRHADGKKDTADLAKLAVQRDDAMTPYPDCYAGEWIYVDPMLALVVFLRKRPDLLAKLRKLL